MDKPKSNKQTLTPVPLKENIFFILDYIEKLPLPSEHMEVLETHIKQIRANYIEVTDLVRIATYAKLYAEQKKVGSVSRQAIYQLIDSGKAPEIVIDEMKFLDKSTIGDAED